MHECTIGRTTTDTRQHMLTARFRNTLHERGRDALQRYHVRHSPAPAPPQPRLIYIWKCSVLVTCHDAIMCTPVPDIF